MALTRVPYCLVSDIVSPEMFGAPVSYSGSVDDSTAVNAAIAAAISTGKPLILNRLYRCGELTGISQTTGHGLTIRGNTGKEFKRQRANSTGLEALANGQDYILKFGVTTSGTGVDNVLLEDFMLSGADKTIDKGLLWAASLTQVSFRGMSFRRAKGSLIYANKLEDANFIDCGFALAGNSDDKPIICWGDAAGSEADPLDRIGNNAIRFIGNRFEFHDGPITGIEAGTTNAWASSIFFDQCKFESGAHTTADSSVAYGSNRASYFQHDYRDGLATRVNVYFDGCHHSNCDTGDTLGLFRVGGGNDFISRGAKLSASNASTINLFTLEAASSAAASVKNFAMIDTSVRTFDTSFGSQGVTLTLTNKNYFPITYNHPIANGHSAAAVITNRNTMGLLYGAEIAVMDNSDLSIVRCVTDPDPVSDASLYPGKSVLAITGASPNIMTILAVEDLTQTIIGYSPKLGCRARIFMRVKKSGNVANAGIIVRHGATEVNTVISNTTWAWKYVDIDLGGAGTELRIKGNSGNQADHTVYLDAVRVEFIDFIDTSVTYNPANLADAARTSTTITVTGASLGDYVEVFPPAGYAAGPQGILCYANVTAADTVTLYLQNNTGGAIDLASDSWMVRVHKRNGLR